MSNKFLVPGTVKQGYLIKSPPLDKNTAVFKGWKKRWVILYLSQRELFLQYYENEESARGSSPPKSTVSLRFCDKVDVDLEHSTYKNVFSIHLPERTYYFAAPSHFEMQEWSDAICTHLQDNQISISTLPSPQYGSYSSSSTMPPISKSYGTTTTGSSTLPGSGTYGLAGSGTYGLAGSGTYGLAGSGTYGLAGSGTYGLAGSGTYGLAGSGTYGLAGSSTYGLVWSSSGTYGSAHRQEIQQRDLPAIPQQETKVTTPTTPSKEDDAPPLPPRFHNIQPNLYSVTPTR